MLVQIFVQNGVVMLGDMLDYFVAMLFIERLVDWRSLQRGNYIRTAGQKRAIPKLFDFKHFEFRALRFLKPDDGFFRDEIDNANEGIFLTNGPLNRNRVR